MSATKTTIAVQSAVCLKCFDSWDGDLAHSRGDAHCRSTGHEVKLTTTSMLSLDERSGLERKTEGRRVPQMEPTTRPPTTGQEDQG